jgi:hypothetical protein
MKIKVNEKSIKTSELAIKSAVQKVLANKKMLQEVGDVVVEDIRFQARRGNFEKVGVASGPFSSGWLRLRRKIALNGKTHEAYSLNRKNVTLTGELLDALTSKVLRSGVIKFLFEGRHKKYQYKGIDGTIKNAGSSSSNADIAAGLEKQGFRFFRVREALQPRLKRIVISYIRRAARVFTKTN